MTPIGRPHQPEGFAPPQPSPDQRDDSAAVAVGEDASGDGSVEAEVVEAEAVEAAEVVEVQAAPSEAVASDGEGPSPTIEDLVEELEAVILQRDQYLELARLKQAEFENFRKQAAKRQIDYAEQAAAGLVTELLPVLDALDNGVGHGDESLVPVRAQLLSVLEKEGLERVHPDEEAFDPTAHDAVAHEPGEGAEPVVAETLRAGYRWRGRLVRPAMVRVRG